MPQLIALAVAGAVAYTGYKWIVKHNKRTHEKVHAKEPKSDLARDLGKLDWDDAAGVYRPRG